MKRALVFLLLGPILGICGAILADVAAGRAINGDFGEGAVMAYFFSLVVSAATGPIDGYLARIVPIYLRVPLTAIVGATIAVEAGQPWHLGLSAVLEEKNGTKSFWALAHGDGLPDFHNPDCFVAKLP